MKEQLVIDIGNPIVRDHRVLGRQTLPGLAYIDVLFQVFRDQGYDYRSLELMNVTLYRPLVVSDQEALLLEVQASDVQPGLWNVSIDGRALRNGEPCEEVQRYATAQMRQIEPVEFHEVIDMESVARSSDHKMKLQDLYAGYRDVGLVHHGFMQAQGELCLLDSAIYVDCRLGEEALAACRNLMFHPALIDASAVCAGGALASLEPDRERQLALPIFYESFRAAELLQQSCVARLQLASSRESNELGYYTLEFFNDAGRKVAELKNFASKLVRDSSFADPVQAERTVPPMQTRDQAREHSQSGAYSDIERFLQGLIADKLGVAPEQIDRDSGYYELGVKSAGLLELVDDIEQKIDASLPPTLLFEYVTIGKLAAYLVERYPSELALGLKIDDTQRAKQPAAVVSRTTSSDPEAGVNAQRTLLSTGEPSQEAIAIVGMAGRFPAAQNVDEFWDNLKAGKDCITEIPASRWDWRRFDSLRSPTGKRLSRWGGFLDDVDCFDAQFFRISPREAESLDPQERLFLQTCWEAMEDAGYTPAALKVSNGATAAVGVFAGVMHKDYALIANEAQSPGHPVMFSQSNAAIANRVSYFCDFHGPSLTIDTVCSSSLIAVHLALQSLRAGECTAALVGGVNLSLHPAKYQAYGSMDMHASDGRCRTFGTGGDGYVSSEAVAAVLLKPLSRAIEDGDQVYAVIRGSATNHVGAVSGFTVPSPTAQADLIAACMDDAGVEPRSISYIEAHGTGTSLGDPIEIDGLSKAFARGTQDRQFCAIGSVKSNIGHAESAAGVCGLIKVALQLHHRTLVPSLHSETLNPLIDFARTPFKVQRTVGVWQRPVLEGAEGAKESPLIAGLSSFGASGSNAHLLLEEYSPPEQAQLPATDPVLIVLSAKNATQIKAQAKRLRDYLQARAACDIEIHRMAYTLQVGRVAMDHRLALIVSEKDQLLAMLEDFIDDRRNDNVFIGQVKKNDEDAKMFGADDDVDGLMDVWIAKRKLQKLALAWVRGLAPDWHGLYTNARPIRMSLPTYPFVRERHWLEAPARDIDRKNAGSHQVLHPLVQRNTSTLSEQRFSSTLTGEEFFLSDHRVKGACVLPGVALLEMARVAVLESLGQGDGGQTGLELRNVVWLQPLVVGAVTDVHIGLYEQQSGDVEFEIYTSTRNDAQPEASVVIAQGRATRTAASLSTAPLSADLAGLRSRCHRAVDVAHCYEAFSAMRIDYGLAHRGLTDVKVGTDAEGQPFVLAQVALPECVSDTHDHYVLHPSVLDSALQAAIGFSLGDGAERVGDGSVPTALPFSLGKLQLLHPCPATATVIVRPNLGAIVDGSVAGALQKLDFDICDDIGRVCVRLQAVASRVLKGDFGASPARTQRSGVLLFSPGWEPRQLPVNDRSVDYDEQWILLAPQYQSHLRELEARYPSLNWAVLPDDLGASAAQWCSRIGEDVFGRVQTLLRNKPKRAVLMQVLLATDGVHGEVFGALSGLLKSAHHENAKFFGQLVGLPSTVSVEHIADVVVGDAREAMNGDVEIRYLGTRREVARFEQWSESTGSTLTDMPWKDGGVYLCTGGAGGLGVVVAREIASQARGAKIILAGRSALNEERYAQLKSLGNNGCEIEYRVMDVTDAAAVDQCVGSLIEQYGRLNGVINSAGLIKDSLIISKSREDFLAVLAPKTLGTQNLDHATQSIELDFMILFSSAAGALGNVGQCDYAMANAFMDRYAAYRNRLVQSGGRYGRTVSINWPLWAEGGMGVDDAAYERMQRHGFDALSTRDGLAALYRAWSADAAQVMVLAGDLDRLGERVSARPLAVEELDRPAGSPGASIAIALQESDKAIGAADNVLEWVLEALMQAISRQLKVKVENVDVDAEISEFGFDSISLTTLGNHLNRTYGLELSPTIFFEYSTIRDFAVYLVEKHGEAFVGFTPPVQTSGSKEQPVPRAPVPVSVDAAVHRRSRLNDLPHPVPLRPQVPEPIAIVGISGRFPGARDLDDFWTNLQGGKDCISEIPPERWDWREIYGDPHREANKTNIKWGGFIEGVDEFDALFFGISPKEAEVMDPQQRLLMMYAWKAIEDAGYAPHSLSGSRTGIFVGTASTGYGELIARANVAIEGYSSTGTASSIGPNRMSYLLNLHGPSEPIETACSSSLVAIHRAIRAMQSGDCDAALVGGVNTIITPWAHISFSKAGMLCEDGRCKTFSKQANGYVRGEGVGMLFLKKLSDAERDGDHIYALIRGSAENHGGRANSLTAPNPKAQAQLLKAAYREAQVDPHAVSYVEMHGTGTPLGDPIEINGLKSAFADLYTECAPDESLALQTRCGIGSVKTNIGHLELAAGVAGVIKVVLQLQHKTLVPTLHCDELNPYIQLEESPFYVVNETQPWPSVQDSHGRAMKRTAGVSSFGFGGANAHVILEEYGVPEQVERSMKAWSADRPALIVLSARVDAQLTEQARQLLAFIHARAFTDADLADIAYTLQVGRNAMEHRLAFAVTSIEELKRKLGVCLEGVQHSDGIFRGHGKKNRETPGAQDGEGVFEETLDNATEHGGYERLLERWVNGLALSWAQWHAIDEAKGATRPRRISLPSYPFAKRRCWIDVERKNTSPDAMTTTEVQWLSGASVGQLPPRRERVEMKPHRVSLRSLSSSAMAMDDHWTGAFAYGDDQVSMRSISLECPAPDADHGIPDQSTYASDDGANRNFALEMEDMLRRIDATTLSMSQLADSEDSVFAGTVGAHTIIAPALASAPSADIAEGAASRVHKTLKQTLSSVLGIDILEIGDDDAFVDLGLDSIVGVQWVRIINDRFGIDIDAVRIYDYPSLTALVNYVTRETELAKRAQRTLVDDTGAATAQAASDKPQAAVFAHLTQSSDASTEPALPRRSGRAMSQVKEGLRRTLSTVLGLEPGDIADDDVFVDIGLDSIMAIQWVRVINSQFSLDLEAVRVYDYPTLDGLTDYVIKESELATRTPVSPAKSDPEHSPIPRASAREAKQTHGDDENRRGHAAVFESVVRMQEIEPGIVQITMADREHKNMFSNALISGLTQAFEAIRNNETYKVVVLTGYDTYFCCGGTKESLLDIQSGRVSFTDASVFSIPLDCKIPVIAALQGHAIGAGWALAMFSDFVVFSQQGCYESNYMKFGFTPGAGATLIFPEKFSSGLAHEILFTGRQFTGSDLEQRGIPYPVVHRDQVLVQAIDLARSLCQSPRIALMELKEHTANPIREKLQRTYEKEVAMHQKTFVDNPEVLARLDALHDHRAKSDSTQAPSDVSTVALNVERPSAQGKARDTMQSPASTSAIAIVGMSGAFANSRSVDEFWRNLLEGNESVDEVPLHRWPVEKFYDPDPLAMKKTYSKWMGTLQDVDRFDAQFFNISRAEAEVIDPQQRLFLEHSWSCIEDAGINPRSLSASRCGVFVGCGSGDYAAYADFSAEGMMGNAPSILAARISYFLNLKGPCLAIDTACSSALVAIAEACDSLLLGRSDLALAGGVNVLTGPGMHIMASRAGMLSKQGRCFTFDDRADGFVPGEGVGVVLLKRYSDALRDEDIIHGVIRGWGVNQDGKTNGITAPSVTSQIALEKDVYKQFCIDPQTIGLVEAHGTGTGLGDPIEVQALTETFRSFTERQNFCALGSVKSNIGHLLAAAGIAGVIKVLLAMRHQTLPPTINFKQLNSRINLEGSPFFINTEACVWNAGAGGVRRAAVSSFGFSGTNSHIVIDESPVRQATTPYEHNANPVFIVLSAKNEERLKAQVSRLLDCIEEHSYDDAWLVDIAYTLQVGRDAMESRLAVMATSMQELVGALGNYLEGKAELGEIEFCFQGEVKKHKEVMSVLNADGAFKQTIAEWLGQGRYAALLELWVKGLSFDWTALYGAKSIYGTRRPKRISLPTYPFARERFWPKNAPEIAVGYAFDDKRADGSPDEPIELPVLVKAGEPASRESGKSLGITLAELTPVSNLQPAVVPGNGHDVDALRVSLRETSVMQQGLGETAVQVNALLSVADLRMELAESLAKVLYLENDDVDMDTAFSELGLDSVTGVGWIRELNQRYGTSLGASQLYDYPTIKVLASHLLTRGSLRSREASEPAQALVATPLATLIQPVECNERVISTAITTLETLAPLPPLAPKPASPPEESVPGTQQVLLDGIAVIGLSGAFPKARNAQVFWENLAQGLDCVSEIPSSRWSIEEHYDPNPEAVGKTYCKWMGCLEEADRFDPLFFNISPAEAISMDPQQRLFLEHSWSCIENAGIDPQSLSGSRCGVYAGCGPGDYGYTPGGSGLTAQVLTGNSSSILSARISYFLNLRGPCVALDTACSSSLVAIALACDSLVGGSCDVALAGGVCVLTGPSLHIMTSRARMLSPQGRSFAFDARADGFVPGEGVGVLLLKRFADAVRDGDQIQGVVRGWGVNHDGKTNGMTAPSANSQASLEKDVYARFEIDPATITLVEAHGTGTKLGDPIEVEALTASFQAYTQQRHYCALGSVKSNIGHLLAAAGVSGVIKALLALQHRMLPPTIQYQSLNEHVMLDGGPFYINEALKPWSLEGSGSRRAAVSSFGFSGTNAHVVLEEYAARRGGPTTEPVTVERPGLIVLSARSDERLKAQALQLLDHLQAQPRSGADLADIAYTLQTGREGMEYRAAVMARTPEQVVAALNDFIADKRSVDVQVGRVQKTKEAGWLFEGDEDVGTLIEAWISKNRLKKLAEAWVRGLDIDWNRLYPSTRPKRVSLPTYPFLRERYWLQGERKGPTATSAGITTGFADKLRGIALQNLSQHADLAQVEHHGPASARVLLTEEPISRANAAASPTPQMVDEPSVQERQSDTDLSKLEAELCEMLSSTLFMPVTAADCEKPFSELGVDSIIGLEWIQAVNRRYQTSLTASMLYQHATLKRFTLFLAEQSSVIGEAPMLNRDTGANAMPPTESRLASGAVSDLQGSHAYGEYDDRTVRCIRPSDSATSRLLLFFCLAHGEGSYQWVNQLPSEIEVWSVGTTVHTHWDEMVEFLAQSVHELFDKPVVAWGHCMGGVCAFDVLSYLEQHYSLKAKTAVLSSSCTPDLFESLKCFPPFSEFDSSMSDEKIEQTLVDKKLVFPKSWGMKIISPSAIRNDIELIKTYRYNQAKIVSAPLRVVKAKNDILMADPLLFSRWGEMTTEECLYEEVDGTHLFFISPLQGFIDIVVAACTD
ncbi:SDR family NAD(P)-dependent oxidoreductase [Pseudomonas batumici]|uniref:Bat3 n=2 Tax=Pseudomonas TaxID=286 RepID=D4NZD5_PSEFL|nr:SDR family NAD(P)-dependent oxidoreductase [Pseudomonas batumici]ADD82941.1 Bat3 [Pseudomonas fluorescens]KIH86006.1 Bat3, batumin synthesis operon, polyketide synthase, Malonyl CoA-acyl carrier protein transacylase [Pseudomonas batumici]